ncbi:putative Carboxylic ester hydrolase [Seiridium cardinale]
MASPKAIRKFAGAIPLSNLDGINCGTTYSKYYKIEEEMEVTGNAILNATECTDAVSQVGSRYLVVDGNCLTSDELELYGPPIPVILMMRLMRDDGAAMISFLKTTNEYAFLNASGFSTPAGNLFPIPTLENQNLALYNMNARLVTNGEFRCIDQATVYTGLQTGRFLPDCHSGEIYYIFGNLARQGLPMRDENDLAFDQFILDSFSSFARTYDPNPDIGFLGARGDQSTIDGLNGANKWLPAMKGDLTKRILQWPNIQVPFSGLGQCDAPGLSIDYYQQ